MNTIQKIVKNASLLLISRILSYVLGFIYIMYTARYLGTEGFGTLSFALSFTGIFGILADLGLNTLLVRDVARDKLLASKYLGDILLMKIFLSIFTVVTVALSINLLGYKIQTVQVVYIIVLYVIFNSFSQMFYALFQAYEKMEYQSITEILNNILMFVGVLLVIYYNLNILSFSLIYFVTSAIILGYNAFICSKNFVLPEIHPKWIYLKFKLKEALPFGITSIFSTLYVSIDTVMLSIMQGNSAVGLYTAASKIMALLTFIPAVINFAIFPAMSRLHISSPKTLKIMVWKYFKLMILVGVPIAVGISLLSKDIIFLIYGKNYEGSIIALQILIWTTVFIFANSSFLQLFQATGKQLTVTKIIGVGTIINIILNLLLIPRITYIGAAFATLISEFIFTILLIISTYNGGYGVGVKKLANYILKVIIASLVMGLLIFYLHPIILNIFILIPISAIFYFIVLHIIGGIKKDEILQLKRNLLN